MFKQVFDYNGKPYILRVDETNNVLDSEKEKYDLYRFTDITPPKELYPPRTFDGTKWHGATVEEFENGNKPPVITPNALEAIVADLQMQIAKGNAQLKETEKQLADAVLEISKLKGSVE